MTILTVTLFSAYSPKNPSVTFWNRSKPIYVGPLVPLKNKFNRNYDLVIHNCCVRFFSLLDPGAGHTMDVLSPFISILGHSD